MRAHPHDSRLRQSLATPLALALAVALACVAGGAQATRYIVKRDSSGRVVSVKEDANIVTRTVRTVVINPITGVKHYVFGKPTPPGQIPGFGQRMNNRDMTLPPQDNLGRRVVVSAERAVDTTARATGVGTPVRYVGRKASAVYHGTVDSAKSLIPPAWRNTSLMP